MDPFGLRPYVGVALKLALLVIGGGVAVLALLVQAEWRRIRSSVRGIRELELPTSAGQVAQEVSRLREKDPGFDLSRFERWAEGVFTRVLAAEREGTLPSRVEVSDGMYRRALVERNLAERRSEPSARKPARLVETKTIAVFNDPHFDAIHVRLRWAERDEVWVFVRRPGAKTKASPGGGCPNCGAPYAGGESNLCSYCQAVLNSGQYQWVLTQRVAFSTYRGPWREFTGMAEMSARDPGFCPEVVEDRAALIFWKWLHARQERDPRMLARIATPEMLERLRTEADELARQQDRWWVWNVAVAGVDLMLIQLDSDAQRDEVCLRVRWTGSAARFSERSAPFVPSSTHATLLTLVRRAGSLTDVRTGVSSDRCPGCLAANSDADAAACAFCGRPYAPLEDDFILDQVSTWEAWIGRRQESGEVEAEVAAYLPSFRFVDQRRRLLQTMALLARADGEVSRRERALLRLCARMWRVPFREVQAMLDAKAPSQQLDIAPGSWPARAFVQGLTTMAAIDGRIHPKEVELIRTVARRLAVEIPSEAALKAAAAAVNEHVEAMRRAAAGA